MTKAEDNISSFRKFGWKLGLERMRALCGRLGDPQDMLNVIHVAGTNGKGSVCRYLYEVLLAHGHTAGLFTSPGLGDFRSRIEADGEWISEDGLERCTDRVMSAVAAMSEAGDETPTEFEVLTTVALVWFASLDLDFVVLEVGLGGAADSTNIISSPLVSVITEISLDHTEHLGDTTEKIAAEKAGIIKPGRPVVTSATGKAAEVIARRAYGLGAPLVYARADIAGAGGGASAAKGIRTQIVSEGIEGTVFSCEIRGSRYDNIALSMPGRYQVDNAVCALAVFDVLRHMRDDGHAARPGAGSLPHEAMPPSPDAAPGQRLLPLRSSSDSLRAGMKAARLPGRFQVVSREPLVIFDGAHNPAGAAALRAAVGSLLKGKRIVALIAMMRDKRTDGILKEIREFAGGAVFTETANERGMDAGLLADAWPVAGGAEADVSVIRNPREAYDVSLEALRSGRYDALVVCGSLYLISELLINS
ncbi:MAG: bifunctional folylpolyglutamate synthase/dihydrofolate synthase [Clostridiales Family XIII bacterium]|jgi:dihydrofolate synthase/folylpolyglutamate synthase|nr:bifunctional folylpolyglutamate synthase/dihydrofolate synthase [Clostridiales Family XIII bacterium]